MKDEFSIVSDEYHKTLFGDDCFDVFYEIMGHPLIFEGVNEELRKYLSYLFIREIAKMKGSGKMEKIWTGFELMSRMIREGELSDYDLRVGERRIIYRLQKTSAIKVKGLEREVRQPFWYIDKDELENCAKKERKRILRRIRIQAIEYSSQSYYQCSSCGEVYDSLKSLEILYKCEKCGYNYLTHVGKHPDSQWLRDVLKRMNAEVST